MRNIVNSSKKISKKYKLFYFGMALFIYTIGIAIGTRQIGKSRIWGGYLFPIIKTNIKLPINYFKSKISPSVERLTIDIKYKDLSKIEKDREQALQQKNLYKAQWVKAKAKYMKEEYDLKMRLKGFGSDHWQDDGLWSYKINVGGGKTLFGMKKFALQHPRVRGYLNEWYFHELMRYSGIISPRYEFTKLTINGENYPIYAVEENFGKRLIENNNRREGPIFNLFSKDEKNMDVYQGLSFYEEKVYQSTKEGRLLLRRAKRLMTGFLSGELSASEVFDINLMAKAIAISDLLGHEHSVDIFNMRYYLNPITGLIEPIPFDHSTIYKLVTEKSNINYIKKFGINRYGLLGEKFKQIGNIKNSTNSELIEYRIQSNRRYNDPLIKLFSDKNFSFAYGNALEEISQKEWLDKFFNVISKDAKKLQLVLYQSYPYYEFEEKNTLYENQTFIRNQLISKTPLSAFITDHNKNDSSLNIRVFNTHSLPVEIISIINSNGVNILERGDSIFVPNRSKKCFGVYYCENAILGKTIFKNINLKIKKNESFNIQDLNITSRVVGTKKEFVDPLYNKDEYDLDKIWIDDIKNLDFINIDNEKKRISVKKGNWSIYSDIVIPPNYSFLVFEGTTIDLLNDSVILSYSPIYFSGKSDNPILIKSSDKSGQGIAVINSNNKSNISETIFDGLSSLRSNGQNFTGAVTFYESDLEISDSFFKNNYSEDALNIIRGRAEIINTSFDNIFSDAIDLDFSKGNILGGSYTNIGNDGIDISGTKAYVKDVKLFNIGDKGISAGEKSNLTINQITINNANMGIASKDQTTVKGDNVNIISNKIGLASYQKKPEFGSSFMDINGFISATKTPILLEIGSNIKYNGQDYEIQTKNVFNKLYGNE